MHGVSCIFISERKDWDPWKAHKLTSAGTKHIGMDGGWPGGHATQHPPVDGASCRMLVHVQLQSFCYLHFAVVVCHALHRIVLIIMTRK